MDFVIGVVNVSKVMNEKIQNADMIFRKKCKRSGEGRWREQIERTGVCISVTTSSD